MRQLLIEVPRGEGQNVMEIVRKKEGVNTINFEAIRDQEQVDALMVHLSNNKIEEFLEELEPIPNLHVTLIPRGVIALQPPASQAPQQVKNVALRSPLEVFLGGLQSVGSWQGFLGYAIVGAIVVWIGLFTNTNYLLVAAMLISPFAGPAMNAAIASARGDWQLLGRSVLRYLVALGVAILVAAILSFIFQQKSASQLMIDNSQISVVAVLLPLVAGAAGALNLVQSERSSLVSGAATGMLVAASLAPPAGLVGMAIAIGRWNMVINGGFLLLLQLFGINLSAAILFRSFGLSFQGARYKRGKKGIFPIVLTITSLALVGLLTWQLSNPPHLQRSSQAQRATAAVHQVLDNNSTVKLVEANVRFTQPQIQNQNTLLCVIYVQRQPGVTLSDQEIRDRISRQIQSYFKQQDFNVTPLVTVTVLEEVRS